MYCEVVTTGERPLLYLSGQSMDDEKTLTRLFELNPTQLVGRGYSRDRNCGYLALEPVVRNEPDASLDSDS